MDKIIHPWLADSKANILCGIPGMIPIREHGKIIALVKEKYLDLVCLAPQYQDSLNTLQEEINDLKAQARIHFKNTPEMCDCEQCLGCQQITAFEDLMHGYCEDCFDDLEKLDLEDRLEKLL